MEATSSVESVKSLSFNPFDPIGSILDGALDDVEKTMEKVTNRTRDAFHDIIVHAGEQAATLISSLKAAYADSLQLTYEKADKLMRENIDRLNDLVKDIISQLPLPKRRSLRGNLQARS